ncbi:MAG: hypothetical protein FWC29_03620 [Methanomassiliicoccaceae archaeon]|nr:hypothetical protein [Methanomassiliicoccaceae archaeon]
MKLKNKMQNDRSGIATILIVVIIVVVVVAAAGATYFLVLNKDDNNNDDNEEQTWAPGTVMEYDRLKGTTKIGTYEIRIIGQNSDEYFVSGTTKTIGSTISTLEYGLDSKGTPAGAVKSGTITLDTMHGEKTLDIWTYEGSKFYIDPSSGIQYGGEIMEDGSVVTLKLTIYSPVWQTSYKESNAIGKAYEYSGTSSIGLVYSSKIECVADCLSGQYGVKFAGILLLSNNPQGLPLIATNTGDPLRAIDTIHGSKQVQKWTFTMGGDTDYVVYYDPVSHIVYGFAIPDPTDSTTLLYLDLKKVPA